MKAHHEGGTAVRHFFSENGRGGDSMVELLPGHFFAMNKTGAIFL
jgi:hypothetical protein